MKGPSQRFGETAVQERLLTPIDLTRALDEADRRREGGDLVMLGEVLVRLGMLTPRQVVQVLQRQGVRLYRHPHHDRSYNVVRPKHGKHYFCPLDGSRLIPVSPEEMGDARSVGVVGIVYPDGTSIPARSGEHALPRSTPSPAASPLAAARVGAASRPSSPPLDAPNSLDLAQTVHPRSRTRVPVPKMTPPAHLISNAPPEPTPARQVAPRGALQARAANNPGASFGADATPSRQVAPRGSLGLQAEPGQLPPVVARPSSGRLTSRLRKPTLTEPDYADSDPQRDPIPEPPVTAAASPVSDDDEMQPGPDIFGELPGSTDSVAAPAIPSHADEADEEELAPMPPSDASFSTGAANLFTAEIAPPLTTPTPEPAASPTPTPLPTGSAASSSSGSRSAIPAEMVATASGEPAAILSPPPPPEDEPALDVHPDQRFAWRELLANRQAEAEASKPAVDPNTPLVPFAVPGPDAAEPPVAQDDEPQRPSLSAATAPTEVGISPRSNLFAADNPWDEPTEIGEVPAFVRDAASGLFGGPPEPPREAIPSPPDPAPVGSESMIDETLDTTRPALDMKDDAAAEGVAAQVPVTDDPAAAIQRQAADEQAAAARDPLADSGAFSKSDDGDGEGWTRAISAADGDLRNQVLVTPGDAEPQPPLPDVLDSLDAEDDSNLHPDDVAATLPATEAVAPITDAAEPDDAGAEAVTATGPSAADSPVESAEPAAADASTRDNTDGAPESKPAAEAADSAESSEPEAADVAGSPASEAEPSAVVPEPVAADAPVDVPMPEAGPFDEEPSAAEDAPGESDADDPGDVDFSTDPEVEEPTAATEEPLETAESDAAEPEPIAILGVPPPSLAPLDDTPSHDDVDPPNAAAAVADPATTPNAAAPVAAEPPAQPAAAPADADADAAADLAEPATDADPPAEPAATASPSQTAAVDAADPSPHSPASVAAESPAETAAASDVADPPAEAAATPASAATDADAAAMPRFEPQQVAANAWDGVPEDALKTELSPPPPTASKPSRDTDRREFVELDDPDASSQAGHSGVSSGADWEGAYVELPEESTTVAPVAVAPPDDLLVEPAPNIFAAAPAPAATTPSAPATAAPRHGTPAIAPRRDEQPATPAVPSPAAPVRHAVAAEPPVPVAEPQPAPLSTSDAAEIKASIDALLPNLSGTDRTALLTTLAMLTRLQPPGTSSGSHDQIEGW